MAENLGKGISLPITTYIVYTDSRQLSRDKVSRSQLTIALSPRPAPCEKPRNPELVALTCLPRSAAFRF